MSYTITRIGKAPKGDEIVYLQEDGKNQEVQFAKSELKQMMKKGLIEVSNYYLDSEGRLRPSFTSNSKVDHTPNKLLSETQKKYIMQYGLVHFFKDDYMESTQKKGLEGKDCKPMKTVWEILLNRPTEKCKEYNMIWFYINDEHGRDAGLNEIKGHKAAHRATSLDKMCAAVWYPNAIEVENLRYRPEGKGTNLYPDYKAPAVITVGDIPAKRLEIMRVEDYLQKMSLPTLKDFENIARQLLTVHNMLYEICQTDYIKIGFDKEKGKRLNFIGETSHPFRYKVSELHNDFMQDYNLAKKLGVSKPECKLYYAGCKDELEDLDVFCYYDFHTKMYYLGTHFSTKTNYENKYPTLDTLVRFVYKDVVNEKPIPFANVNAIKHYLEQLVAYLRT